MSSSTLSPVAIDRSTTKELERLAKKLANLMNERDRLILKATYEGASLREVGGALGMSHVTVKNILAKLPPTNLNVMTREENEKLRRPGPDDSA